MIVYLDTKDQITLVEKKSAAECDAFEELLRKKSACLAFSLHNIIECCVPLLGKSTETNVMQTLNRLERMPHVYIAEVSIQKLELIEAINALTAQREYAVVKPFVSRFDYVLSALKPPPTKDYLQYGLAQMVFELWTEDPELFKGYATEAKKLQGIMEIDRQRDDYKKHVQNFPNTIGKNLDLYQIEFSRERVTELADWILANPIRCPSMRLGYEVFHKILRNIGDKGEISDIPDLSHIDCIPYVDMATLDNRIRGYVAQADNSIGTSYSKKIYSHVDDINKLL